MAANNFATMLHRNSNKIALILIYAALEWILILLLLLNSLLSYLIIRFAEFFGLQPPCPWCTRLDHIFYPRKDNKNMHRDLLCEVHSREISELAYCSNHRKLAEISEGMCEHCLSSKPEFGVIMNHREKVGENGEVRLKCSCCGASLDDTLRFSYTLLKTSFWDVLECAQKENLITEAGDLYEYDNYILERSVSDKKISDFAADLCGDDEKVLEDGRSEVTEKDRKENASISLILFVNEMKNLDGGDEDEKEEDEVLEMEEKMGSVEEKATLIMKDKFVKACVEEEVALVEISPQDLEFFLDCLGHKMVPVQLVDLVTEESRREENVEMEDHEKVDNVQGSGSKEVVLDLDLNVEPKCAMLDSMELEENKTSLVFRAKDCSLAMEEFEQVISAPVSELHPEHVSDVLQEMTVAAREMHLDVETALASEELARMDNNENEAAVVLVGTDIPDLDRTNEIENKESVHSYECTSEDPSTSSANLDESDDQGRVQVKEQMMELQCLSVQDRKHTILNNLQPSYHLEVNEIEEDKVPDMPTYVDSLNEFQKELVSVEKGDPDESLDGSVTSELEGSDGVVTIQHLKSALRTERMNLRALYAELEEERSASAVAVNQTMAMINRLQEEKAAIEMEAFQYQRMMEVQSEYDQEALQLMNELIVKSEKEKQELEKQLEVYRKKLLHYETKEKIRVLGKTNGITSTRSGSCSASCSNADDCDGLSIDLNQEAKEEEGSYCSHEESGNHNTPVDTVMNLEESLADFEEERLSILAQLKVLEEKHMVLDDGNEKQFEGVEAYEENENHRDEINACFNGEANGFVKEMNGEQHHQQRGLASQKGKLHFTLYNENGDMTSNGNGFLDSYDSKFGTGKKKQPASKEEVDHPYDRLQGLAADRQFIKHYVNSLRKDYKGMKLLQEILQHLRDLRKVEGLHDGNLNDSALI